jgi:prephenate dehydrogenase
MFNKITLIGCGLIGSSLLRVINKNKLSVKVSVYDKSKEVLNYLKKNDLLDNVCSDIIEACKDADLVIIASPLSSYKEILLSIKDNLKKCYFN